MATAPSPTARVHSRYGLVPYPWRAAVGLGSPHPARFYADLIMQSLRFGLPARRRLGPLLSVLGRHDPPKAPLAAALRAFGRRADRPDLDRLLRAVVERWPELVAAHDALPHDPPALSALALQRRAALTLFVFGERPAPLLVLKVGAPGDPRVEQEVDALRKVRPAALAPRPLGLVAEGWAQEALEGAPMRVEALGPTRARALEWPSLLDQLAEALSRLAEITCRPSPPDELRRPIERALADGRIGAGPRRLLAAAWRDLRRLEVSVLRHRDTSPQNCLFAGGRFVGIVDWEDAAPLGAPGYDVLNAALAYLDHGVGLRRWSEELVLETFRSAWAGSFGRCARECARDSASAAAVPEDLLEPLELSLFGWRVGRRLDNPSFYPTSAATAARMLELAADG